MFAAIKKQTSDCSFYFNKSLYSISNLKIWNHGKKERKRKALLAYIADVICLTNRPFYMRTLSLSLFNSNNNNNNKNTK